MKKVKIIQYSISFVLIVGLFFLNSFLNNLFSLTEPKEIIGKISDGFMVPGVLFCVAGILTWVNKEEFFDMIGYAFSSLGVLFGFGDRALEGRRTYKDYKDMKDAKGRKWYPFLLISGLITLLLSIIFFIIYLLM